MQVASRFARQPRRWPLGRLLALVALVSVGLVVEAPALYNTDFLTVPALLLLAALLCFSAFAGLMLLRNLWWQQWPRAGAWLLLAGLSLLGWWVSSRIAVVALSFPNSPDDPALASLIEWERIFPFLLRLTV